MIIAMQNKRPIELKIVAFLLLCVSHVACRHNFEVPQLVQGAWVFQDLYVSPADEAPVQEMSEPEARQFIGKILVIAENEVEFPCSEIPACSRSVRAFHPKVHDKCSIEQWGDPEGKWVSQKDLYLTSSLRKREKMADALFMLRLPGCSGLNGLQVIFVDPKSNLLLLRLAGFELVAKRSEGR